MKMHTGMIQLAVLACSAALSAAEPEAAAPEAMTLAPQVVSHARLEFGEVSAERVRAGFDASGVLDFNEDTLFTIVPRIGGVVAKNLRAPGDRVQEGDPLVNLESRELGEAMMVYIEAEHQLEFAREALGRESDLHRRKVSSAEMLAIKELEFQTAQLAHTASLQPLLLLHYDEVTMHRFADNPDHANLTLLQLKAPGSGEVIARHAHPGQAVEPDTVLFQVANLSELWVNFHLALADAPHVAPGSEIVVRSSVDRREAVARVVYVAPFAEADTRRVPARAVLANADGAWRPGTPVVVSGRGEKSGKSLSVPAAAVVDLEGQKVVFVREGEDRFRPTPIEAGVSDGERIEVRAGTVSAGDRVVTRNAAQLKAHWQLQGEG